MRRYTDRYNAARKAGAKPIILAFVWSDRAVRCFGKDTPTEAMVGTSFNVLDWQARVLTFGDFRQTLSSDSEKIALTFQEQEMTSYNLELDNADGYFSVICGREEFIGGQLRLYQGFDYPDFTFSDCQLLFRGSISNITLSTARCTMTADYAMNAEAEDDLTVSAGVTFSVENGDGSSSQDLEDWFYNGQPWEITLEYTRGSSGVKDVLFSVDNDNGVTRIEMGVGTDNYFYIEFVVNANNTTETAKTLKSDFTISVATHTTVITYNVNGSFTIVDGVNSIVLSSLHLAFTFPVLPSGNIFSIGCRSKGTPSSLHPLYVCDYSQDRIAIIDPLTKNVSFYGSLGTGLGEFWAPTDVTVSEIPAALLGVTTQVCIAEALGRRVQIYFPNGEFTNKTFGSGGTGDGQFSFGGLTGICNDYDVSSAFNEVNLYTADGFNARVQKFIPYDTGGASWSDFEYQFSLKWGSSGSGDGQFNQLHKVRYYGGFIWTSERAPNHRIQKFDTNGNHIATYDIDPDIIQMQDFGFDRFGNVYVIDGTTTSRGVLQYDNEFNLIRRINNVVDEKLGNLSIFVLDNGDFWATSPDTGDETDLGYYYKDPRGFDSENYIENETVVDDAFDDLVFPTTADYANPGDNQQNVTLPLPYGTLTENSDGAVWVAPCIDSVNFVYCVAGWPIQSVANGNTVTVYVDGLETGSGWTFDESNNYEGLGNIAILDFVSDPGGVVSVRCNGKWVDGALLTNPVDIVEDLMDYAASLAGVTAWRKDASSFAFWKNFCDTYAYDCAGAIIKDGSLSFFLKEILASFAGTFYFSRDGEVKLNFMSLTTEEEATEEVFEYEAISHEVRKLKGNLCRQVVINYAVSFVEIDRRFREGALSSYYRTYEDSIDNNGDVWTFEFNWTRDDDTMTRIANRIFELYGSLDWILDYTGQDFKFLPIDLLDQVEATFSTIRDEDGNTVDRKVFEVQEKTMNLDDYTTHLVLRGLGNVSLDRGVFFGTSPVYFGGLRLRFASS